MIGVMYLLGQGVKESRKQTLKWYELSALTQGLAGSQHIVGVIHAERRRYKKGVKWYRLAARQGHSDAQNNLARAYIPE